MTLKIYTRTGDEGETALYDGRRVPKDSPRVECLGALDELDAFIGLARNYVADPRAVEILKKIQKGLYVACADLAMTGDARPVAVTQPMVDEIERVIDEFLARLDQVGAFILTGSTPASAHLHVARTVCRRAERRILALGRAEPINPIVLKYVNRLADCLYALARASEGELVYQRPAPPADPAP